MLGNMNARGMVGREGLRDVEAGKNSFAGIRNPKLCCLRLPVVAVKFKQQFQLDDLTIGISKFHH